MTLSRWAWRARSSCCDTCRTLLGTATLQHRSTLRWWARGAGGRESPHPSHRCCGHSRRCCCCYGCCRSACVGGQSAAVGSHWPTRSPLLLLCGAWFLPEKEMTGDRAGQFSNRCDVYKVAKVVYGNWSDNHCNESDTTTWSFVAVIQIAQMTDSVEVTALSRNWEHAQKQCSAKNGHQNQLGEDFQIGADTGKGPVTQKNMQLNVCERHFVRKMSCFFTEHIHTHIHHLHMLIAEFAQHVCASLVASFFSFCNSMQCYDCTSHSQCEESSLPHTVHSPASFGPSSSSACWG